MASPAKRTCKKCLKTVELVFGLLCAPCAREYKGAYNKRYYADRREKLCAEERARSATNRDSVNAAAKERYRRNAERYKEQAALARRENPERVRAHTQVREAVRKGLLIKPVSCEQCGTTGRRLHAHHHDYAKPLDVQWICVSCHKREHVGVGVAA